MEVTISTFKNPFSFFCIPEKSEVIKNAYTFVDSKKCVSGPIRGTHGQYVAVLWNNSWTRGIVSLETNFMIWLVDFGIYYRPDINSVYVNLPADDRKHPSRVFEASIYGIVPLDKVINEMCEIENQISMTWNKGAIERAQELINNAISVYLVPIALLNTKHNEVVLGDLYLRMLDGKLVNIIEELIKWPVFVEKNHETYIKNLSSFYPNRKVHRACQELPLQNLPTLSIGDTLEFFENILKQADDDDDESEDETTVIEDEEGNEHISLTPSEIVEYSEMSITINGHEYNALQLLLNKIKDLEMCEKFYDEESVGRAITHRYSYLH